MTRVRPKPQQLWDDKAFRVRLSDLAKRKGKTVRQMLAEIGLTQDVGYRAAKARSANVLMLLAGALDVSPAELAGWVEPGRGGTANGLSDLRDDIDRLDAGLSSVSAEVRALRSQFERFRAEVRERLEP